jgi:hypothetical protein
MAHDVFISYSSKDKEAAKAVCAKLESEGIKCWIAPRDIPPSAKYAQSIMKGISSSRVMIFIFSSHAGSSEHIESEIDRAFNKNIPIIPLRLEDIPLSGSLEYYLSTAQWFDALTPPLDDHLERLPEAVRQLLETNTQDELAANDAPRPTPASLPPQKQNFLSSMTFKLIAGFIFVGIIAAVVVLWFLPAKKTESQVKNDTAAVVTTDSFVVDSETNLMWAKGHNGANINWNNAVKYCENLVLGGFNDWRLPSRLDLKATNDSDIPESDRIWKAIQVKETCCYWTSNEPDEKHALAYNLAFETLKFVKSDEKDFRALCVRHSE